AARQLANVTDADDVRALQPCGRASLAQEPLARDTVGRRDRREHLDRDLLVEQLVVRGIDDAHAALAEDAEDPVLARDDLARLPPCPRRGLPRHRAVIIHGPGPP